MEGPRRFLERRRVVGAPQRVKGHLEVTLFIQKKRKDLIPDVAVATGTNRPPPPKR